MTATLWGYLEGQLCIGNSPPQAWPAGSARPVTTACAPPTCSLRMAGFDGSAWDEEEEEPPGHQYYNDFPGKEPPLGGVVDMRLREGAPGAARPPPPVGQTSSHLGATLVSRLGGGGLGPRMGVAGPGFWSHLIFVPAAGGAACGGRPGNPQTDATSATLPRCEGSWEGRSPGAGGGAGATVTPPFP